MQTRRHFLTSAGLAALLLPHARAGRCARSANGRTLVVVFLRGGADGLNWLVPYGDEHYARHRPQLAQRPPGRDQGVHDLDGFFGLHARAGALRELFREGLAVALPAVGHGRNTRSHFEEQDVWDTCVVGDSLGADGWLNRYLVNSEGRGPVRAVAIGDNLPRGLRGDAGALALRDLSQLGLGRPGQDVGGTVAALKRAYKTDRGLVSESGRETLAAMRELEAVAQEEYVPAVAYPETDVGRRAKEIARLIKADVGLEIAELDIGGWDTHRAQGAGAGGTFGALVGQTSDALTALVRDLEDRADDVLVLVYSEFGRTVRQNGTGGTDHGWGNALFALGGPVARRGAGRGVLGKWPGLAPEALQQGRDLQHTVDFRDVFAEALGAHLGVEEPGKLLDGHQPAPVGLI